MEYKQLFRSNRNRVIAGVAGGIGEYFQIDPIIVRILFVVFALFAGGGVLAYIVLWIIVPEEKIAFKKMNQKPMENETQNPATDKQDTGRNQDPRWQKPKHEGNVIAGFILITLGILFLIDQLVPNINFGDLWPVFLIVVGIALIYSGGVPKIKKDDEAGQGKRYNK